MEIGNCSVGLRVTVKVLNSYCFFYFMGESNIEFRDAYRTYCKLNANQKQIKCKQISGGFLDQTGTNYYN